ncbi:ferritin-like domain-containing protein [Myxococcus sp. K15C18031901]|uniref:ferritin-like domain-containing protein n=1 Tax=Myxococcus dinghuensis TaxID=2906761 RepID=UPI0020A72122|nr:ferritin-like domain-containing protein [Myxococcus dinghuensis]MCP3101546.1 ferritin-like domain-containing protein [Myxococcus dinghuensis]
MDSHRLRLLFTRALRASLVSPLVLAGCDGGSADLRGFVPPACADGSVAMTGLSLPSSPDFVQLRITHDSLSTPGKLSSTGTPCATASQPATCQAELEALRPEHGFGAACEALCGDYFLATSKGDEVSAIDSKPALKTFLGGIDAPQEAVLLALSEGYNVSCHKLEQGGVKAAGDSGFQVIGTQGFACGEGTALTQYVLLVSSAGGVTELERYVLERGDKNCQVGRVPVGLRSDGSGGCEDVLGHHFAVIAHLEAASIQAFLRLREELALHGAEVALQEAALRSAREEVRHTDITRRLAARHGASAEVPRVEALPLRSFYEVSLDNAVEGCVRETFGALVAHHQALHARDEEVRVAMAGIAEDETRHAELSWEIDRWAAGKLPAGEREALRVAQRRAVEALRAELSKPVDPVLVSEAGLPSADVAVAMLDTLARELWA